MEWKSLHLQVSIESAQPQQGKTAQPKSSTIYYCNEEFKNKLKVDEIAHQSSHITIPE
jgi:hypothetical protein